MEEAEAIIRSALTEITREDNPKLWASTQDSLGFALTILGERDRDPAKLEEAISIFHSALETLRPEDSRSSQVITQHLRRAEGARQL